MAAYRVARRRLREEAGMEPGPQLRALADGVLRHTLLAEGPPDPAARSATPFEGPHYADAEGRHVAWGTYGAGQVDVLLLNPTFLPIDAYREEAHLADAIRRLAKGRRVVAFDRSGLGLSDPVAPDAPPSVAQWARDAVAVLDASGAGRVHVLANADTGMIALQLAAEHPDRVASVTAVNAYARATVGDGYSHGEPASFKDVLRGIRTPGVRPPVDVLTWIAPAVAGICVANSPDDGPCGSAYHRPSFTSSGPPPAALATSASDGSDDESIVNAVPLAGIAAASNPGPNAR